MLLPCVHCIVVLLVNESVEGTSWVVVIANSELSDVKHTLTVEQMAYVHHCRMQHVVRAADCCHMTLACVLQQMAGMVLLRRGAQGGRARSLFMCDCD